MNGYSVKLNVELWEFADTTKELRLEEEDKAMENYVEWNKLLTRDVKESRGAHLHKVKE